MLPKNAVIRRAAAGDCAAVECIVERAYAHYIIRMGRKPGPMLADYPALIGEGLVHLLDQDGTILGLLVLIDEGDVTLLDNVAVDPVVKGKGHGQALMRFAEQSARERGHRAIRLYTHETMVENIALYLRIGYAETHRAEENGLRRVFMTKALR
ncbi:MAG: GNAT family N-acetyltransferase [Beijerinckiaceae bacterium]|nr:GNAT family N-acetyltransferase [Beijerinckiaceae bacterium]